MKMIFRSLLLLMSFLMLFGCSTTKSQSIRTTRAINLPPPEVSLKITLGNDNIEILGPIDITRTLVIQKPEINIGFEETVKEEHYGIFIFGEVIDISFKGISWGSFESAQKQVLGVIIHEIIDLYPDIDYVLFPKIQVDKVSRRVENLDVAEQITMRLIAKAVKINL
jgi:hypothetical protein